MIERELTALLHATAAEVTRIPAGVVEASIEDGLRRSRLRRRRWTVGLAAAAAVFGGSVTYGATALVGQSPAAVSPSAAPARQLAVAGDQMAQTLTAVLTTEARAVHVLNGAAPGRLAPDLRTAGYPDDLLQAGASARTGYVVLQRAVSGGVARSQVVVVIERLDKSRADRLAGTLCPPEESSGCTPTAAGRLLVWEGDNAKSAVVSLLTPDSWLVTVATATGPNTVPVGVTTTDLTRIALSEVWWR
ncbi:hypothetical protein GCM10027062_11300 [Nocardioides hungaricus]